MTQPLTLLITSPSAPLVAEIAMRRPAWHLAVLGDEPPSLPRPGAVWAFVDWLCPTMSGLEQCRRLREFEPTRHAHLTMVLEEPSSEASRRAMLAGADDYLVGPLNLARVLERVDNFGLTAQPTTFQRLAHGPLSVDLAAFQVRIEGSAVAMRPNEFRLLAHFLTHPDRVFSRTALIDQIGKDAGEIDERTVDVWVGRLRRVLTTNGLPDPLRTVRGLGYVLDSLPG